MRQFLTEIKNQNVFCDEHDLFSGEKIRTIYGKLELFSDGSFCVCFEKMGTNYIGQNFTLYNQYKNLRLSNSNIF